MDSIITSDILSEAECLKIIRKRLMKDKIVDFQLVTCEIKPSEAVGGFMGEYFRLTAVVTLTDKSSKTLRFFVKAPAHSHSFMGKYSKKHGNFDKEVYIYNDMFPEVFKNLEPFTVPECYLAVLDRVIVLDDIVDQGFAMLDKVIPLEMQHCKLVLTALAKFHAQSMIFENKSCKTIQDIFSFCLYETLYFRQAEQTMLVYWTGVKALMHLVDLAEEFDAAAKVKFKEKIEEMAENHVEILLPSDQFKNVLCHGDLWVNNIMFKTAMDGGNPTECCLLDFQQIRYTPPALDILFFLQCSTTREFRDKHSLDLYRLYHETLSKSLIKAKLNPDLIFPFQDLLKSIDNYQRSCLFHSILLMPIIQFSAARIANDFHDAPDSEFLENFSFKDRSLVIGSQFNEIDEYRERIIDGLIDFYDKFVA